MFSYIYINSKFIAIFIVAFMFINSQSVYSQKGCTYREYTILKDTVSKLLLEKSKSELLQDMPLLVRLSTYNKSLYGIISTIYSKNNKNSEALKFFKKMIYEGANMQIINYTLNNLNEKVKAKIRSKYLNWIHDYTQKRQNCTLCDELKNIYTSDQSIRRKISFEQSSDTSVMALWKKQKLIDSINEKRLYIIADDVIDNFFEIKKEYDDSSYSYTSLDIYFGHYNEKTLLRFKDKIIAAASKGKCSWDLAKEICIQLIFKFPFELNGKNKSLFIYDIYTEGSNLDIDKSFLQLSAMESFFKDNQQYKIKFYAVDDFSTNIEILHQMKLSLTNIGMGKDRIAISDQKYLFKDQNINLKSKYVLEIIRR